MQDETTTGLDREQQDTLRDFAFGDEAGRYPTPPQARKLNELEMQVAASLKATCPAVLHTLAALRDVQRLTEHDAIALLHGLRMQVERWAPRTTRWRDVGTALRAIQRDLAEYLRMDAERAIERGEIGPCERLPLSEKPCTPDCSHWDGCRSKS